MTVPGKVRSLNDQFGKASPDVVRSLSSEELMAGQRVIVIRHGRDEYKLQITSAGKLILTK